MWSIQHMLPMSRLSDFNKKPGLSGNGAEACGKQVPDAALTPSTSTPMRGLDGLNADGVGARPRHGRYRSTESVRPLRPNATGPSPFSCQRAALRRQAPNKYG